MPNYFVTATGTEIGKTYFCCKIIQKLISQKKSVNALKPVISDFDINSPEKSDSALLLQSLGKEANSENLNQISPYQFKIAAAPDIAARKENKPFIEYSNLLQYCTKFLENNQKNDFNFIEGVGGVMVPLNEDKLVIDLIADLQMEVILVAGNYLGTISHTLTALTALQNYNIKVKLLVINDSTNNHETYNDHKTSIANFSDYKITMLEDKSLDTIINYLNI